MFHFRLHKIGLNNILEILEVLEKIYQAIIGVIIFKLL